MKLSRFRPVFQVAAVAALVGAAPGCTDFSTTPQSLGRVTVAVTDQDNAGVPNLIADLLLADRVTVWRSIRTSANGTGEFGQPDGGVKSQQYLVRLILAGTNYSLASGEANDKPVTVVIGQTHPVTFKVVRSGATPPP